MDQATAPDELAPLDDLSALAWVQQELQRSLDAALKALRRTMREAETIFGGDVEAIDPAVLRSARQHLHQGAGALELIGLPAAAALLRACESAVQRYLPKPHALPPEVVADIERATFALMDYLARLLAGRPVSALSLFPQYRAVQESAGAERVHPADLWEIDWKWRELPVDASATPRQPDAATRSYFEQQLLAFMRGAAKPATRRMSEICAGLGRGAEALQEATLWKLASAVFEAQSLGALASDLYSKRVASRLLAQLRSIERGQTAVSERLAQDLVFFCAQAVPPTGPRRAPRLEAARAAYGFTSHVPTDYAVSSLGRFDPAWIAQARKRVGATKEAWSQVAGGEMQRVAVLGEQMTLLADSLKRLFAGSDRLAAELQASAAPARLSSAPSAALAMEVATALLYLEASLDDSAFDDPLLESRLGQLAGRVAAAREGGVAQPLERWMEELYRRVSDSQTMGSVVQELRASLSDVEAQIDRFFRDPGDREVLIPVPNTLGSMRGVLSVLGMDQASAALLRMRDDVEALAATEIDPTRGPQAGTFERLADNLGALGFLIDMLGVQPQLAKSLFTYDAVAGTFSPVMGRQPALIVPVHGAAEPGEAPPAATEPPPAPAEPPAPRAAESDDMREVFLEEAREVVAEAQSGLMAWIGEPSGADHAAVLRRAFHTLKGSARMVGLHAYGEAGWACEQVMNAHIARQRPADEQLLGFIGTALTSFDGWTDAAAQGDDAVAGGEALIAEAHALLAQWTESETGAIGAAASATAETAASLAGDDTDTPAVDVPRAASDAHPAPSAEGTEHVPDQPPELPSLTVRLDHEPPVPQPQDGAFPTLDGSPRTVPEAPVSASPERAPTVDEPEDDPDAYKQIGPLRIGIPLFNIYLNEADELSRRLSAEIGVWSLELHRPPGDDAISLAHSLAGSSATVGFADLSRLCRSLEHALMRAESIGLADADEARLFTAVADDVRRLLHQFAAGFLKEPQADLQRRLDELAATDVPLVDSAQGDDHGPSTIDDAPVLHLDDDAPLDASVPEPAADDALQPGAQGEQGSAPEAQPEAEAVPELEPEPEREPEVEPEPEPEPSFLLEPEQDRSTELEPEPEPEPERLDGAADSVAPDLSVPAPVDAFEHLLAPISELKAYTPLPSTTELTPAHHDLPSADDDIDAVDAIDPDLFPVFEEEALELLPLIGDKLREWAGRPDDVALAAAVMRVLHTFKGGARLSGAMRLGELAHRLEYRIEELLASGAARAADIDALQMRADRIDQLFEALRTHDAERYAAAIAAAGAPLELPVPAADDVEVTADDREPPIAERPPSPMALFGDSVAAALDPASASTDPVDWGPFLSRSVPAHAAVARGAVVAPSSVRVKAPVLDRLVNQIGEVSIARSRLDAEVGRLRGHLGDLTDNLDRLRLQLRDIELQAETQMASQIEAAKSAAEQFDPLEFDRYTRFQELTRMMAESVNDVATVQRSSQRTLESAEDELAALGRLTRDLQGDLLRSRMVEFESLSDRLYRVVRQAAKETGKQVRLDLIGGGVEVDRGVLDRMTPAFEHLLRNAMAHGIETPEVRTAQGKDVVGTITVALAHEGNEVAVEFRDDGAGLDLARIRDRAIAVGLATADQQLSDDALANFIFASGFSTVESVTELAGRGIGMDVVRSEVDAIGGRIETATTQGAGSSFKLILPLTTAVTQVVMLRCGDLTVAVPSTLVEIVRRATQSEVTAALASGSFPVGDEALPFYWLGALLQHSAQSAEPARTRQVLVVRSARQRIALHVDEVLGNQEVVVKNLGPQLSRMPGLAGMTLLTSGAVAPIYNPVALATLYGADARAALDRGSEPGAPSAEDATPAVAAAPLVLVVDDSLTVRRVTQRLLTREGYRVVLAKDGLDALERLAEERPRVVLSDIEMPRMDGFDLVRNMRADPALRHLPVIMITSRIAHKHREYAMELGVEHYLGKPYAEDELLALVARSAAVERTA